MNLLEVLILKTDRWLSALLDAIVVGLAGLLLILLNWAVFARFILNDSVSWGEELPAYLALAERAIAQSGARDVHEGEAENETTGHGAAGDEEMATADYRLSHGAPPPARSRQHGVWLCEYARRCRSGKACWTGWRRCPHQKARDISSGNRSRP